MENEGGRKPINSAYIHEAAAAACQSGEQYDNPMTLIPAQCRSHRVFNEGSEVTKVKSSNGYKNSHPVKKRRLFTPFISAAAARD